MPQPRTYSAKIVTRAGELFQGDVVGAVIPGAEGYFGVKAHHAPLIAALGLGEVVLTGADQHKRYFALSGGVVEVRDNQLIVLADIGEQAEEIDVDRAAQAAQRARTRLKGEGEEERVDITRAEIALGRALNRLRVAKHRR